MRAPEALRQLRVWEICVIAFCLIALAIALVVKLTGEDPETTNEPAAVEREVGEQIYEQALEETRSEIPVNSSRDLPNSLWWIDTGEPTTLARELLLYPQGRQISQAPLSRREWKAQRETYVEAIKGMRLIKIRSASGSRAEWLVSARAPSSTLWVDGVALTLTGEWTRSEIERGLQEGRG